ncbi:receptor-like cytoplasmic kinase 176 [Tanacetum coccineum]|uniref:Receptor-like cytoplasmic kinase 176 n=1 Tax=Tanacetum coccineum TaxID=301880 RepID=A0ABQ5EZX8_9ASTR
MGGRIEKTESSGDEDGQSDSESEDANDLVDEEHLVEEVEVNMNKFNFQLDGEDETDFIDPIQPHVNVTEDDLEVLDFDSLESDQEDVPENARSRGLRKLRKKHMSYGIRNNFYIGKEFANRDLAKERIRAYAVETRMNLDFKVNDKRRIRVICNGVVPTLNSKNEYVDKIQGPNQDISEKGKGIMQDAKEDKLSCPLLLYLSKGDKSKWAKAKAQVYLREDVEIQYSLLRDYANKLQRCNPDTTVKIDVYGEEDHKKPTRMFRRIYVCLGALKRDFKESGRELLGLDGAFMRGQYYGQMLTAVGVDANNGIYLVAYGIVESENQYSWTWFLTCLGNDFDLYTNSNFTFITDKQKGLVPTIAKLFPAAKCWDIQDRRQLLDARDSPIITSLEYVREYLMKRIVIVQKIIQKSNGPLTPVVTKVFNKIKEAASECSVYWNGSDLFQVKGPYQDQCVVNLNQNTCSCRKWEISGIPCKHAIAAIHDMADNGMDVGTPEDWVHESYKLQTWMNVYAHKINPINGRDMWSKFECPTKLLPPKKAPQIGRPPKNRKKSKGEIAMVKGHKLTRKGTTVTCSNCKGIGHNKRGCKVASQPVSRQTRSRGPVASQPVSSQTVARKQVARKPVTRKPVQASESSQHASGKRPVSQINEPASQASRLPTSPMKRTKMTACRLTPDS